MIIRRGRLKAIQAFRRPLSCLRRKGLRIYLYFKYHDQLAKNNFRQTVTINAQRGTCTGPFSR